MRGSRTFFVLCIISSLLASLAELVCPKIISFTVDSVIGSEEFALPPILETLLSKIGGITFLRSNLWAIALTVIILAVLMGIFNYSSSVFNRRGAETLVENMRNRLFHHIEHLPFSWYMSNQTGDII